MELNERRKFEQELEVYRSSKNPVVEERVKQAMHYYQSRNWKQAWDELQKLKGLATSPKATLLDAVAASGLYKNRAQARRAIEAGSVLVDGHTVRRTDFDVTAAREIETYEGKVR